MCWRLTGACLKCGAMDHKYKDCPQRTESQASVGNVLRAASGQSLGRDGRLELATPRVSEASGRVQPTAPARTYAVQAREQQRATDMERGKLSLLSTDMFLK